MKCFDGREYVHHNLLYRNYVYNASMVVFRRDVYAGIDKSFQRLRCAGDWQFWVEMALTGPVLEVRSKLNRFRQHSNKVTVRGRITGEDASDTIKLLGYLLPRVHISAYKRWLVLGMCYRRIRKSHAAPVLRSRIFAEAEQTLGASVLCYGLARANRMLAYAIPFLPTHKREKLK